jgi:peptide/nickel transport system permease protein
MIARVSLLLAVLMLVAIAGPWLAPHDPEVQHRAFLFAPPMPPRVVHHGAPSWPFAYPLELADRLEQRYREDRSRMLPLPWFGRGDDPVFLLGTDSLGRDLLSRMLHGARISLALGLASAFAAVALGALVGLLAGWRGGWLDDLLMRAADLIVVLPLIYVVLVLRALLPLVLAPSTVFALMTAVFAIAGWPFVARGVRGIVAVERSREYVLAARALGAGSWRIMTRHLLPACGGYLLVQTTLLLPAFILAEATLSYVGLGFPEHVPTWGTMLIEAANPNAMTRFPWTLAPAGAIFAVVLATNLVLQSGNMNRSARRRPGAEHRAGPLRA